MATLSNACLGLFQASEPERGSTVGFGRCCTVAGFVGGSHVDETLQLVVQIAFGSVPTRDPAHDGRKAMQEPHAPSIRSNVPWRMSSSSTTVL